MLTDARSNGYWDVTLYMKVPTFCCSCLQGGKMGRQQVHKNLSLYLTTLHHVPEDDNVILKLLELLLLYHYRATLSGDSLISQDIRFVFLLC
jgi:hypothetical protein